jgi:putative membrane protein insertion efficiency factor
VSTISWGARLAILIIRAYQLALSPFSGGACRFVPSCSEYATDAVAEHGPVRGLWLAVQRVARCHPFARHGYDPVPRRHGSD